MKKLLIVAILILNSQLQAKPSKAIKDMMNTEVSAFDFFLYQLYDSTKCKKWYGYENPQFMRAICMNHKPKYDKKTDTITLQFRFAFNKSDEWDMEDLENFKAASKKQRHRMIHNPFSQLIGMLGLKKLSEYEKEKFKNEYTNGLMDNVFLPEKLIKEMDEIKNKTILKARFYYGDVPYGGLIYDAKLEKDGSIIIGQFDFMTGKLIQ